MLRGHCSTHIMLWIGILEGPSYWEKEECVALWDVCWATGNPLSFLSGFASWPDGILLACHHCDWPLGLWPRDIWLTVHSSHPIPLIPHYPSFTLSLSRTLATCLRTTAVLCVAWCVSLYWLHGHGWLEDCAMIAADNCTIIQHSQSVTARWLFAMHEALSAVTYQGTGVIQL